MYFSEFSKKKFNAKLFGISKISCYHLKGKCESFSQKIQRCLKSTHKLPISPFSKYHKNCTISPFSPIFFVKFEKPESQHARFNPCAENKNSFH